MKPLNFLILGGHLASAVANPLAVVDPGERDEVAGATPRSLQLIERQPDPVEGAYSVSEIASAHPIIGACAFVGAIFGAVAASQSPEVVKTAGGATLVAGGAGLSTYFWCMTLKGNDCENLAGAVGSSIATIEFSVLHVWDLVHQAQGQKGTVAQGTNGEPAVETPAKRAEIAATSLENKLRSLGHELEGVMSKHDPDANSTTVYALGVRSLGSEIVADLEHTYDEHHGTGVLRTRMRPDAKAHDDSTSREHNMKRLEGPAFKISYRVSHRVDPLPFFDDYDKQNAADTFARGWASHMNTHTDQGPFFGKLEFGNSLHLELKVSPEAGTYDTSYEDVTECGEWNIVPAA